MAQIKEFSSADLNTISRFGGVSNTLDKINGVTVVAVPAGTFLLDTYTGAAAAYSTRKLKSSVTVAARIRRSGDDIEADVEFDSNNEISLTSPISNASSGTYTDLADFVDHTGTARDAFIDEWKDQSGNSNHAAQATAANQPQLYDATTGLITENGKPAVYQDGSRHFASSTLSSSVNENNMGLFAAGRWAAASPSFPSICSLLTLPQDEGMSLAYRADQYVYNDIVLGSHGANDFTQRLWSGYADNASSDVKFYRDGVQKASTTPSSQAHETFVIGSLGHTLGSTKWNGYMQEVILYGTSTKADHSDIETNINSDYLIYQPTDAPTSGLLATYTGAAAAYSVRQLSNKAVIALRVRRDSDDEERNIGWDSNGDLDTTAISAFCGTANGYVTRWWDQSTNANHADQATDASQPQIYNGTAVITENGKPALNFQSDVLFTSGSITLSDGAFFSLAVGTTNGSGNNVLFASDASPRIGQFVRTSNTTSQTIGFNSGGGAKTRSGPNVGTDTQFLIIGQCTGTLLSCIANGTAGSAASHTNRTDAGVLFIGARNTGGDMHNGYIQEAIHYADDQSSNRTGIESDINDYFSIYT